MALLDTLAKRKRRPSCIEGLRRLEYRGYDSAGVCILADGKLLRAQAGRARRRGLARSRCKAKPVDGTLGISHTRWATHGLPSDDNSHPHLDQSGKIAIVHNGVIENYATSSSASQRPGTISSRRPTPKCWRTSSAIITTKRAAQNGRRRTR